MIQRVTAFSALTTVLVMFCYFIVAGAAEKGHTLIFKGDTFTAILEKEPLKNILEEIRRETGIRFRIAESESDERVSVQFENLTLKEGLRRILRTMNYSLLFDRNDNLTGAFIFGKVSRKSGEINFAELNEQMLQAAMDGDTPAVNSLMAKGADVMPKGNIPAGQP